MAGSAREYAPMYQAALGVVGNRAQRMRAVADLLWDGLSEAGVSWIGFYSKPAGADEMILEACRNKPACSPIGLHGACGQSWRSEHCLVVRDVRALGDGYVACDPRDQSEVVVPLFDESGACWGVLDGDSFDVGAFDESDARELAHILHASGLTARSECPTIRVV